MSEFKIGDIVHAIDFRRPLHGKVIVVDEAKQRLVVKTDKGNFSVAMCLVYKS